MKRLVSVSLLVAALAAPSFASAQSSVGQPGARTLAAPTTDVRLRHRDPNARICEDHTEMGSRLNRRRTCMTRAEWARLHTNIRDGAAEDANRGLQGGPMRR